MGIDVPVYCILYLMEREEAINVKRQIIEKGVKQLLEEAQIPARHHLKVVKRLHKALQDNEKQQKTHEETVQSIHAHYQGELEGLGKRVIEHEQRIGGIHTGHIEAVQGYQQEIEHLKSLVRGEDGNDGQDGQDAPPVDVEALASKVLSMVPMPEKGDKGEKGDMMPLDDVITAVVKRIQKGDVIHVNNVKGAGAFIKDGIRYRFDELMHGSGSSSNTGGTGYQVPTSGVVDGVNQTFTWATTPHVIVVDQGRAMQKTSSDTTVNWTGTTTTILAVAPTADIYATA